MGAGSARPAGGTLTDREFRFGCELHGALGARTLALQAERETWIRHSIVATFAFFGWIALYRDEATAELMLRMGDLQAIYLLPMLLNLGGALRFAVIQRDLRGLAARQRALEATLELPAVLRAEGPGEGWHLPSVCYWAFIVATSAAGALFLGAGG